MMQSFAHLRLHTEYSLVDGLLTLKPLLQNAASDRMSAIAITDHNNLFAAVKFYKLALSVGVKPIIGADVSVYNEHNPKQPYLMTCLCQNQRGYRTLMQLVSNAYLQGSALSHHKLPMILPEWFAQSNDGLILFSGERGGDVGEALLKHDEASAAARLDFWLKLFGNRFYLEIQRNNRPNQDAYIKAVYTFAQSKSVPLVATNDVRFLNTDDYDAHEARVCIHDSCLLSDKNRSHNYSEQQYFKSQAEMAELFSDLPEALANTIEISKRCTLELSLDQVFFPKFTTPEGLSTNEYCTQLATAGLNDRLAEAASKPNPHDLNVEIYQQRLQHELSVIHAMGFSAYFLIVADFIAWARDHDIPVGPGRGSGAGSLVAYALRITDIDPIPYKLLFERFLNPERVSLPDFDIDFCMIGRDRVIEYVAEKYGRQCVAQIITFGTMAAKAVVRDVGRVLAQPYGFVDKLAKLIPFELGITLEKALAQEETLRERYEKEEEVHDLIDLARKLEGITRNAGKHAGGVVIAPSALTDFTALYCEDAETDGSAPISIVTQFDKDDVEAIGLIKFDFLGLRTLTIIDWAVKTINQTLKNQQMPPIDISTLPLADPLTYELIKNGETSAVFQIESRGMKDLIRRLQPDCFEDIIALVALYRPGPLQSGMVDDFIDRKHGRAPVLYPHASLEEILKPTYGVILYQEQVMQIAQVLAGYTLGSADLLRRAMGKKKPEEMAKQREVFLRGAEANKVARPIADTIFDLMEKFAGYGFNKSHSAAYALISYQTAWLKAHYPAEYMAAVLSSDMDNTDKVVGLLHECRRMGLQVLAPDVNASDYYFTVPKDTSAIRYGLGAIKGIGHSAVQLMIDARQQGGSFHNLFEFFKRIEGGKLNRRTMESLIRSGAFDSMHPCRATLLHNLEFALTKTEQEHKRNQKRQQDLFAILEKTEEFQHWTVPDYVQTAAMTELERLQGEKDTLGFYLSGHPLDRYLQEFDSLKLTAIADVHIGEHAAASRTRGILVNHRQFLTRNGAKMGVITIEDQHGKMDVTIFSDLYQQVSKKLQKDEIILVEGDASIDEFNQQVRLIARKLFTLEEMFARHAHYLLLNLTNNDLATISLPNLMELLGMHRGGRTILKINVVGDNPERSVELTAAETWHVQLSTQLLRELEHVLGAGKTRIVF